MVEAPLLMPVVPWLPPTMRKDPPALDDAAFEAELDRRLQEVGGGTVQTMTVEQAQAFLVER